MIKRLKQIVAQRRTLWDMSMSLLKAKYAGSILGFWWAVIVPVVLAASINFVFGIAFKVEIPQYALFVLSGIIPWFFLSNALVEASGAFIARASLLRQGQFPREFIPLSQILAVFLNSFIGFIILLPLFTIVNTKVAILFPWLFLVMILQFFFVCGIGLFLACANVYFKDVSHFLSIWLMLWMWITPVFYSPEMLGARYQWVCTWNPAAYYIVSYHCILHKAVMPDLNVLLVAGLLALISFVAGYVFFIKNEATLMKRI
jgi:ABC-2 type transport system permease protein